MRLNEHCKLSCFTQITANFIIINVLHFISFKIFCFLRLPPKRSPCSLKLLEKKILSCNQHLLSYCCSLHFKE